MTLSVEKLLDESGIAYKVVVHQPVYTVAESMNHMPDKYPVKNLLLNEEKGTRCIFVIMKGDERLDIKKLASALGSGRLSFAKPNTLMEKLGVLPGSASLFSLMHKGSSEVEVVIDKRILEQTEVGFHPSDNSRTIFIAGKNIETILTILSRPFLVLEF